MDLNLTLIGQIITFALFVVFTMKYVWPPLLKMIDQRRETIADGLAAAEQGQRDLELAQHKYEELLQKGKGEAAAIIEQASRRAHQIVESSKDKARQESEQMITVAKADAEQQYTQAREQLKAELSKWVVQGAERLIDKNIDAAANQKLLDDLLKEI